jgi:hypothetical protein
MTCPAENNGGSVEEPELLRVACAQRQAAMTAVVDAVDEPRMASRKHLDGLDAAAGKALLAPDFVKTPRIAAIAADECRAGDAQPARDPNVDGVGIRERPRREWREGRTAGT